ncbi:MAG: DUF4381 domain-containing protein [Pseudomonadota bacterium]
MTGLQLPHDIIEPAPIGWWPLAPGWWLLIVISVAALFVLGRWLWRRRRKLAPLRQALQELRALESQWQQQRDHRAACAALSALLKRMARLCYPQEECARLTGPAWQAFLLRTGNAAFDQASAAALQQFYQADSGATPGTTSGTNSVSAPPFAQAAAWLRAQRRPLLQQQPSRWRARRV